MTNINRFDFRNARLRTIVMMRLFDRAKRLIEFRDGGDRHPPCLLVYERNKGWSRSLAVEGGC